MIEVEQLCRNYGKIAAVDHVSFKIPLGEVVGLLGHNGAGKTTIMKMLTGYLEPSSGSITIDGLDIYNNRLEIQSRIGYLPETSPLYHEMIVLDYLRFAASMKGVPASIQDERISYALNKARITEVAEKKISTLSRGYKQRVGVAQAILNSPSILILDEPTNGLDPSQILEMRSLIKELSEQATVIISTHILQEVEAMCNRVIIINKGHLALDSTMDTLRLSSGISLTVDQDVESILAQMKEVKIKDVAQLGGKFHYTLQTAHGNLNGEIPELVQELSKNSCKIYAVHPLVRDLESIFRDITAGKDIAQTDLAKSLKEGE